MTMVEVWGISLLPPDDPALEVLSRASTIEDALPEPITPIVYTDGSIGVSRFAAAPRTMNVTMMGMERSDALRLHDIRDRLLLLRTSRGARRLFGRVQDQTLAERVSSVGPNRVDVSFSFVEQTYDETV